MLKYLVAFVIFVVSPAPAQVPLTPTKIGAPTRMINIQFNVIRPQLSMLQLGAATAGGGQKPAGPCATTQPLPSNSYNGVVGFGGMMGGGMSMQVLLNSMASLGQKPGGPCNPQPSPSGSSASAGSKAAGPCATTQPMPSNSYNGVVGFGGMMGGGMSMQVLINSLGSLQKPCNPQPPPSSGSAGAGKAAGPCAPVPSQPIHSFAGISGAFGGGMSMQALINAMGSLQKPCNPQPPPSGSSASAGKAAGPCATTQPLPGNQANGIVGFGLGGAAMSLQVLLNSIGSAGQKSGGPCNPKSTPSGTTASGVSKAAGPCAMTQPLPSNQANGIVGFGLGGAAMSLQVLLNSIGSAGQKSGGPCNPQSTPSGTTASGVSKAAGPCATTQPLPSNQANGIVGFGLGGAAMSMQVLLNSMASLGQKPGGPCNPQSSRDPQTSKPISGGGAIAGGRPGQVGLPKIIGATNPKLPAVKNPSGSGAIAARPPLRVPTAPSEIQASKGGGGGGVNLSKGGNSAMDTLGNINTSGGLSSAAGPGSGGISDGRPRAGLGPPPPPGTIKPRPREPGMASAPSGGQGGINMTQGGNAPAKGGGTGGINTTQSQSGNSPTTSSGPRYTPTTKLGVKPSTPKFDSNIDYGGCSACGSKKDPLVVR